MCAKRNGLLALLAAAAFVLSGFLAIQAQAQSRTLALETEESETDSQVDYEGFMRLSAEVAPYREERLVDLDAFNRLASKPNTVILDSRSAQAYALGHINGAINIPFSDFTDEKLAAKIPGKDVRILIYCNNNFADDIEPVLLKRVDLALNIPTFINLYGYGYTDLYELSETVSLDDPDLNWVSTVPAGTAED